jgi:hypothetical protein
MRWVYGHPIDRCRNSDEDHDEEESRCATVRIAYRIGNTTTTRWVQWTIIAMADRIGVERRRLRTLVLDSRMGLM